MAAPEVYAGVGGGVLASVIAWFLGRTESAAHRREKEIRTVAATVVADAEKELRCEVRLTVLETTLPEIRTQIAENTTVCRDTNRMVGDLLNSIGHLRRRDEQ